jgi:hypothetical protein
MPDETEVRLVTEAPPPKSPKTVESLTDALKAIEVVTSLGDFDKTPECAY